MSKHDVAIVGSGSGGYKCASLLLKCGLKVALIEKDLFGGVCLNAGCIPKDTLYTLARELLTLNRFGGEAKLIWERTLSEVQQRIEQIRRSALEVLKRGGLTFIKGEAELVDEGLLKVNGKEIRAEHIVLACGSRPREEGIHPEDVLTGRAKPGGRVLIKGGGASAVELAFILRAFGFDVVIEHGKRLLDSYPQIHESFSTRLEDALENLGIEVVEKGEGDTVIKATGRVPSLCRERFPFIAFDENGFIRTDKHLETSMKKVYAVGDLVSPMGAGYAFEKARVVAHNIAFGKGKVFEPFRVPVLISSALEVGYVGRFEEAKSFKLFSLSSNPKSYVLSCTGIARVGYDEHDEPVFLSLIGAKVSELLNSFSAYRGWSFFHPSFAETLEDFLGTEVVRLSGFL